MLLSGDVSAAPAAAAIIDEEAAVRLYEAFGACVASVHVRMANGEGARLPTFNPCSLCVLDCSAANDGARMRQRAPSKICRGVVLCLGVRLRGDDQEQR